jgi:N-methylhydantoinase A
LLELEGQAVDAMAAEGFAPHSVEVERLADLHYAGQSAVVTVAVPAKSEDVLPALQRRFEEEHRRTYGRRLVREPVEFVGLRVRAFSRAGASSDEVRIRARRGRAARPGSRPVHFGRALGTVEAPVVGRDDLGSEPCQGPLIVEEYDCTTVVPPGARARVDEASNIVVQL